MAIVGLPGTRSSTLEILTTRHDERRRSKVKATNGRCHALNTKFSLSCKSLGGRIRVGRSLVPVVSSAGYPYSTGPYPRSDFSYAQQARPYKPQDGDGFSFSGGLKSIGNFFSFSVTAISRFIQRFCPEGTSNQTVETVVKGGLLLLVLAFARAILSLLIAVGSIAGLMFLGTRFLQTPPKSQISATYAPPAPPPQVPYTANVYYPPGVYYQNYYSASEARVIDPYTSDVLTVYRDPSVQASFYSPRLHWPQQNYIQKPRP